MKSEHEDILDKKILDQESINLAYEAYQKNTDKIARILKENIQYENFNGLVSVAVSRILNMPYNRLFQGEASLDFLSLKLKALTVFLAEVSCNYSTPEIVEMVRSAFSQFVNQLYTERNKLDPNDENYTECKNYLNNLIRAAEPAQAYVLLKNKKLIVKNNFLIFDGPPSEIEKLRKCVSCVGAFCKNNDIEFKEEKLSLFKITTKSTNIENYTKNHNVFKGLDIIYTGIMVDPFINQSSLIRKFKQALRLGLVNLDIEIDEKGICNFIAMLDIAYVAQNNFGYLRDIYNNLLMTDLDNLSLQDREKIANSLSELLTKFNQYESLTNKNHPGYGYASCRYNDLKKLYLAMGLGEVKSLGGLTFRFDVDRIARLIDRFPRENIILHCTCFNHAMSIYINGDVISMRDPNDGTLKEFTREQLSEASKYIYAIMGEILSFDAFSYDMNMTSCQLNLNDFIVEELNLLNPENRSVFLNAPPQRCAYGYPIAKGSLVNMASDAGHMDIIYLLSDYGLDENEIRTNLIQYNKNVILNLINSDDENKLSAILRDNSNHGYIQDVMALSGDEILRACTEHNMQSVLSILNESYKGTLFLTK